MYIGHMRLCVYASVCVCGRMTTLLTDPDVIWSSGSCVHYWTDLRSVHGFRCYDNIGPRVLAVGAHMTAYRRKRRTRNVSEYMLVQLYSLYALVSISVIMVALCNRGPLYFYPVVSSFYLSFYLFPRLLSTVVDWMWYGPSTNLECRSEMFCARLAGNAGPKKSPKIAIWAHRTTLSGYIFAKKARINNREKN